MDDVRARLEARIDNSWKHADVPDAWLPRLDELDAAIAAIDPGYSIKALKEKFGSLRFYLSRAGTTPEDRVRIAELIRAAEFESPSWM